MHVQRDEIASLPIRSINFDDPADRAAHDRMVQLVETMLDLHKQLAAVAKPQIAKTIQSVIDTTDRQIDQLVYELYGLTAEEIALVERRGGEVSRKGAKVQGRKDF